MIETTPNMRYRNAIQAAHKARAETWARLWTALIPWHR